MKIKYISLVVIFALIIISILSIKFFKKQDKPITIHIYYTGKNGDAVKFAKEMEQSGTADAIRNKAGNLRYEYFYPFNDKETVLLIDSWRSQKDLDEHHASNMMKVISDLRNKYDLHMKVERFMPDDEGIPSSDVKFIKK